jgi:hypothetical protein
MKRQRGRKKVLSQTPVCDQPVVNQSVVTDQPSVDQPVVTDQPTVDQPVVTDQPSVDQPSVDQPSVDQPVTTDNQVVDQQPITNQPTDKQLPDNVDSNLPIEKFTTWGFKESTLHVRDLLIVAESYVEGQKLHVMLPGQLSDGSILRYLLDDKEVATARLRLTNMFVVGEDGGMYMKMIISDIKLVTQQPKLTIEFA